VNVTSGAVTKYYGGNALKKNGNLQYLFKDHLGSVVGSLDANSGVIESQRAYKPFGDDLLMRGTTPTTLGYTGQRQEPELGLYYYNARWYDPYLARFTQPDTIVPNPTDAKAFDRYAYVYNNPVRYNDPSGHLAEDEISDWSNFDTSDEIERLKDENPELYYLMINAELGDNVYFYNGYKYTPMGKLSVEDHQLILTASGCQLEECLGIEHDGIVVTRSVGNQSGRIYSTGTNEYLDDDFPEFRPYAVYSERYETTKLDELGYSLSIR
jgi:RHS repeat-associated protein